MAGGFAAFAMPPYNLFPILFVSLSILYICIHATPTVPRAFVLGWLFAFAYFVVGLFWVRNALLVDGNPYAWVWPLAVAGLPALLAFFIAFGCALGKKFSDLQTIPGFLGFVAFVALFEWGRGFVFTGFPWNLFGHTWSSSLAMLQILSLSNIYWLNSVTIAWVMLPGFLLISGPFNGNRKILALSMATIFIFVLSFGVWRLAQPMPPAREDAQIRIVQSNIPQAEKWKRENFWKHFMTHIEQSRPDPDTASVPIYIVWSETALSQWVLEDPKALQTIRDMLSLYKAPAYLLTGLLRYEANTDRFYNSLVMIDKFGDITNVYDKNHLVPFGEYVPFQKWIPLEPVVQFKGFAGGGGVQTFTTPEGIKYSPVICYEIIFAGEVAKQGDPPDFILNVTNDSWYGDTAGPRQHLEQAVYRAIEEGIPVVRVADTGISALIDSRGHIIDKSGLFTEYEKTLALPSAVVVSMRNKIIIEWLLPFLLGCLIFLATFTKRKI